MSAAIYNAAIYISMFVAICVSFFLIGLSEYLRRAGLVKERQRRMAEHRMNARLLRLNL